MFTYRVELDGTVELPEVGAVMLGWVDLGRGRAQN